MSALKGHGLNATSFFYYRDMVLPSNQEVEHGSDYQGLEWGGLCLGLVDAWWYEFHSCGHTRCVRAYPALHAGILVAERQALRALYASTGGDH